MGLGGRSTYLHFNLGCCAVALALASCQAAVLPDDEGEGSTSDLRGENLSGVNLSGTNLSGTNLSGTNLSGVNLGGTNLSGTNLSGVNLSGTNLGGNNLAGVNLSGTNLGATNLSGVNLSGVNLSGVNLSGTNLSGSNQTGTNLSGNNLSGTNLSGSNLSGTNTGRNIHNLAANGMLYSGEDLWTPKTSRCVVTGIGSTAFSKLLGQQSSNAKISVALGKLPWGFAKSAGGSMTLRAWEAVVWGDKTYCVFVLAAPPETTWPGVAGFIKAVFRWHAPTSQQMDVSGIEAARQSPASDSTTSTAIATYSGMMNAASKWRSGSITETGLVAGELGFATATTNNQSVQVDFASWVQDKNKSALVLGNVQSSSPPTYAEALYIALDNGDGTVQVILDDAASRTKVMPDGMTNSVVDLNNAYLAYLAGVAPRPVARRCGGALFLKTWFGEPVPAGKCDNGLAWAPGFCTRGSQPWSTVAGTSAPMNGYMQLTGGGGSYKRALVSNGNCGTLKTVLSETYVHMWERAFDLAGSCSGETNGAFCSRLGKSCGTVTANDNCGITRTVSCGGCDSGESCGGDGVPNVCGSGDSRTYEAESLSATLAGSAVVSICPEAYSKVVGGQDPGGTTGACSGGAKIRYIGDGSGNHVTFNNVNVPSAGSYTLKVWGVCNETRTFQVSVNGGSASSINVRGPDWNTPVPVTTTITLRAGNNTIRFFNNTDYAPDLDRITVSGQASGGGSSCAAGYSKANCLAYTAGSKVSRNGRNYTCANANCMNCATTTTCEPGASGCPWGVVWTDAGACN
jgi:hypothetical protein